MTPFTLDRIGVGKDLRRVRESLGLSLADAADKAGIAPSHLWSIEKGKREISFEKVFRLCASLGLPPSVLINDNFNISSVLPTLQLASIRELEKCIPFTEEQRRYILVVGLLIGSCATVVCHYLILDGLPPLDESFDVPIKTVQSALTQVTSKLIPTRGLATRHELLEGILSHPYLQMIHLGLVEAINFREVFKWVEVEVNAKRRPVWNPVRRKQLDSILPSKTILQPADFTGVDELMKVLKEGKLTVSSKLLDKAIEL